MPEANSLIHSKQPSQLAEFPAGVIFFLVAKPFTKAVNLKPREVPASREFYVLARTLNAGSAAKSHSLTSPAFR